METNFGHLDLVVGNVKASVDFYRRLGLEIPNEDIWEHNGRAQHIEFSTPNGLRIGLDSPELTRAYDPNWPTSQSGVIAIFSVGDRASVDKMYAELTAAGYEGHMAPIDVFWGARYAIVDDPDGNHIGLMSPSDQEHRSAPNF